MVKVFTHENRLILFNVKNLLKAEGIDCVVRNEYASSGVGDLSPFETWPELWLIRDEDEPRARELIAELMGDGGAFVA